MLDPYADIDVLDLPSRIEPSDVDRGARKLRRLTATVGNRDWDAAARGADPDLKGLGHRLFPCLGRRSGRDETHRERGDRDQAKLLSHHLSLLMRARSPQPSAYRFVTSKTRIPARGCGPRQRTGRRAAA